jgi:hypothetical protein
MCRVWIVELRGVVRESIGILGEHGGGIYELERDRVFLRDLRLLAEGEFRLFLGDIRGKKQRDLA